MWDGIALVLSGIAFSYAFFLTFVVIMAMCYGMWTGETKERLSPTEYRILVIQTLLAIIVGLGISGLMFYICLAILKVV